MEVKEQIDILVELQKNETDAAQVRKVLAKVSEKQRVLEKKVASASSAAETAEADLAALRKHYRSLEADVKVNLDLIRKSKSRLPGVQSNKEYQALLKQIEETEKKNNRVEDEMLGFLDQIESGEKALEQRKNECRQAEEQLAAGTVQLEVEIQKAETDLARLDAKRDQIARQSPPDLLATFTKTKAMVGDPMIVPVRGTTCEGCNISIPPQLANELRRFESLNFCPFCNRVIYWEKPTA